MKCYVTSLKQFNRLKLWFCLVLVLLPACKAFIRKPQIPVAEIVNRLHKDAPTSDSVMGIYKTAAVASDGEPCSRIGGDILRANGTAADAAIAMQFCLGITVAESLGIGGGFFLTYYDKSTKKVTTLDCRETAPANASVHMYQGNEYLSTYGGTAVAVAGASRCYWHLYQRYGGGVSWSSLIEPSIQLCEEGYPLSNHMAKSLRSKRENILNEPTMSDFVNPITKDVWLKGDILKQPTIGKTLRILQTEPDAILSGSLTSAFLSDLKSLGSSITRKDLNKYQPLWKDPMKVTLQNGGYTVYSVPPPSSGVILGFILNVLDNYNFTSESLSEANIVTTYQRIVETFKYAYGRRTELGDEAFLDLTTMIEELLSEKYAYEIFKNISDNSTSNDSRYYGGITYNDESAGTSNMGVVDIAGNSLVITSTINLSFGAGVTSISTGVILNNEMDDFSSPNIINAFGLHPSPANRISPGKRPLSSMSPAIILDSDGDVVLLTGAAGGTRITTAIAWQAMNYLWFGKNLKESMDGRRLHHQLLPMIIQYEAGFRRDIVDKLELIGHNTTEIPLGSSVMSAISRSDGTLYAMSDFRKIYSCTDGF